MKELKQEKLNISDESNAKFKTHKTTEIFIFLKKNQMQQILYEKYNLNTKVLVKYRNFMTSVKF